MELASLRWRSASRNSRLINDEGEVDDESAVGMEGEECPGVRGSVGDEGSAWGEGGDGGDAFEAGTGVGAEFKLLLSATTDPGSPLSRVASTGEGLRSTVGEAGPQVMEAETRPPLRHRASEQRTFPPRDEAEGGNGDEGGDGDGDRERGSSSTPAAEETEVALSTAALQALEYWSKPAASHE